LVATYLVHNILQLSIKGVTRRRNPFPKDKKDKGTSNDIQNNTHKKRNTNPTEDEFNRRKKNKKINKTAHYE
jgi:hypothetical protein